MAFGRATALILLALAQGRVYGFDIMDATGLASGSVYPALRRLEREGLVTSRWEETDPDDRGRGRPTRRVYRLTKAGTERIDDARVRVAEMYGSARDLLSPDGSP